LSVGLAARPPARPPCLGRPSGHCRCCCRPGGCRCRLFVCLFRPSVCVSLFLSLSSPSSSLALSLSLAHSLSDALLSLPHLSLHISASSLFFRFVLVAAGGLAGLLRSSDRRGASKIDPPLSIQPRPLPRSRSRSRSLTLSLSLSIYSLLLPLAFVSLPLALTRSLSLSLPPTVSLSLSQLVTFFLALPALSLCLRGGHRIRRFSANLPSPLCHGRDALSPGICPSLALSRSRSLSRFLFI
jgi:hypothetical protein